MAQAFSTPPTDHKSRDQRVVPAGEVEIHAEAKTKDGLQRCEEIRVIIRDFSEDFNYEVTCCGRRTVIATRAFHLLLTLASVAAGILYVMDSMNYTYCKNRCPSPDQLQNIVGPRCPDIADLKNSTDYFYCTHHVYKGIIGYQTVWMLDYVLTGLFTIELLMRAIVAPGFCRLPDQIEQPENYKLMPFFHDPLILLDIVSVLPTYFDLILLLEANSNADYGTFASIVNAFKVLRVFRIFKTLRSFPGTKVIARTARTSWRPLCDSLIPIVMLVFILGGSILLVMIPCNGEVGTEHCEIADMWSGGYFIIITLTAVGYGDMVPHGIPGRTLVILFMMSASMLLAIPLAIIGNKYADAYNKKIAEKKRRKIGKFGMHAPLVDHESSTVRQQRLLNSSMMLHARILGVERRLQQNTETENQKTHDVMSLNSLHEQIAQDAVKHMPIIDRHSKSSANLGAQLTNKVSVRHVAVKNVSKVQPFSSPSNNKKSRRKQHEMPARLGSFRVKDLVNCCNHNPRRRLLVARDSETHPRDVEELRSEARLSASCRDKLWLTMHHPRESQVAFSLFVARALVVVVAIAVLAIETQDFMNFFGANTVLCAGVVDQYCAKITALDKNWRYEAASNYAANFDAYEGVGREELIQFNNFCFPKVCDYGQTPATHDCIKPSDIPLYKPGTSCLAAASKGSNITKCGLSLSNDVSLMNFCSYLNVSVSGQRYRLDASAIAQEIVAGDVPVCQRLACQDNSAIRSLDWIGENSTYSIMACLELLFTAIFLTEFTLRLVSMRNPKRNNFHFFKDVFNWMEFLSLGAAIIELLAYFIGMKGFTYSIWGLGNPTWLFYPVDTFRFLRILVVIRFIYMQKNLHSMVMIWRTFKIALPKVTIPVFFMIIFIVTFAGVFFTFETVIPCTVEWVHASAIGFNNRPYSDPDAMLLRYVYRPSSLNAGDICPLQDVMDGIWLAAVTWTTVGYGGIYPKTVTGQATAMACGLLGVCYMCMPLSVFGSTFYDLYAKQEERRMELTNKQKIQLKRRFGKVMKLISAGVHMKSKSKGKHTIVHHLSPRELDVFDYTFHAKLPNDETELSLKRVQAFKAQHMAFMQALAKKKEEDIQFIEERVI